MASRGRGRKRSRSDPADHTDTTDSSAWAAVDDLIGSRRASFFTHLVDSLQPSETAQLIRLLLRSGKMTVDAVHQTATSIAAEHNSSSWSAVPNEVLAQIFQRLPTLADLRACRATCLAWHGVVWSCQVELPAELT
eukprot:TRINITY_DN1902_c0_g1_i5.p2 TRINITY_DN1902_c0_g1~~TRINITY_DN1902_c0_g1_i5.p2  ORF type:complete len:136 (-),score=24.28 TRINITY_DN1902_c0_g1_i5:200-607(-)